MIPTREQLAANALRAKRMNYVDTRMKAIGKARVVKAQEVAREGGADQISGALLIAFSLRESGGRNVLGDQGHARGADQIHDAYHREFLRSVRGCRALPSIPREPMSIKDKVATRVAWIPIPGTNAAMRGMAPTWEDGARYVVKIINGYVAEAKAAKVPFKDQLLIAANAFNAGMNAALKGYREGNPDKYSTLANYGSDVLLRRGEVNEWLDQHPNWRI